MTKYKVDPHSYSGPLEQVEKKTPAGEDKGLKITVFITIATLALGVTIFFILYKGNGPSDIDSESFLPLIPVWIAIFIPFMAIKRQQKKNLGNKISSDQKRIMLFIVAGTVLLALLTLGLIVYITSI